MKSLHNKRQPLCVRTLAGNATNGRLHMANRTFSCQLGRAGLTNLKREGDGATPVGRWSALTVYYRADRIARPRTRLPIKIIRPLDGWCDDPAHPNYNQPIIFNNGPLPYDARFEHLWRDDHAYDLLVILDHNIRPRAMNKGSAIFIHLTHDDKRPTAGCLAFREQDLRMILRELRCDQRLRIEA